MSFLRKASAPPKTPPLNEHQNLNEIESLEINDINSEKNFWNIKGYKLALKRCDDGFKLGEKFRDCISELTEIEDTYSKSLKKWETKWLQFLQSSDSSEYQSSRDNWVAFLKFGNDIAEVHGNISDKLQRTTVDTIKKWLEDNYKKSFVHFKKTKEFEKQFQDAQKTWQTAMDKIKTAKEDFFNSDKKFRENETIMRLKYSGQDCNTVMKREAERKFDSAKFERERSEKRYKEEIEQLKLIEPRYQTEMRTVFDETQMFEETRLKFFKQIFSSCLELLTEQNKLDSIIAEISSKLEKSNHETDLKWWSVHHGADMQIILPKFEVPL